MARRRATNYAAMITRLILLSAWCAMLVALIVNSAQDPLADTQLPPESAFIMPSTATGVAGNAAPDTVTGTWYVVAPQPPETPGQG